MKIMYHEGDRVRVVKRMADNAKLVIGLLGTVCRSGDYIISVDWDENIDGHGCGGLCEWGHGWNVLPDEVEPAEPSAMETGEPTDTDGFLGLLYRKV